MLEEDVKKSKNKFRKTKSDYVKLTQSEAKNYKEFNFQRMYVDQARFSRKEIGAKL